MGRRSPPSPTLMSRSPLSLTSTRSPSLSPLLPSLLPLLPTLDTLLLLPLLLMLDTLLLLPLLSATPALPLLLPTLDTLWLPLWPMLDMLWLPPLWPTPDTTLDNFKFHISPPLDPRPSQRQQ